MHTDYILSTKEATSAHSSTPLQCPKSVLNFCNLVTARGVQEYGWDLTAA